MLFDQRSSRLTGCCAFPKSIYRLEARRYYFVSNTSFMETIAGTGGFRGSIWTTETTRPNNAFEAAILPFQRYARFAGRSLRLEFWSYTVAVNVLQIVLTIIAASVAWPVSLALQAPSWAVLVRRLHDVDRSGWWALPLPILSFSLLLLYALTSVRLGDEAGTQISIAGGLNILAIVILGIALLIWTCCRGKPEANRYSPPV